MSLVVDASMTLAWYFEDEQTPACLQILREVSVDGATVAVAVAAGSRQRVSGRVAAKAHRGRVSRRLAARPRDARRYAIDAETDRHAWTTTLRFADRFGLTVYDAAYLELADRAGLAVLRPATASLARAAVACGVPVRGP